MAANADMTQATSAQLVLTPTRWRRCSDEITHPKQYQKTVRLSKSAPISIVDLPLCGRRVITSPNITVSRQSRLASTCKNFAADSQMFYAVTVHINTNSMLVGRDLDHPFRTHRPRWFDDILLPVPVTW